MKRKTKVSLLLALALVVLAGTAVAGSILRQKAVLADVCANCATDTPGTYSVLPDLPTGYEDGNGVKSQILNHNAVYTLDTLDTLEGGLVGSETRVVEMHFYSPVEFDPRFDPGHELPPCWGGIYNQSQAVNWSVFSDNSLPFTKMVVGQSYHGRARMDFNVRNGTCDGQIYRYYLVWSSVCIKRTGAGSWDATSDDCGRVSNFGEATLRGQGGRKKETINYGDWRLPFKLQLSAQ